MTGKKLWIIAINIAILAAGVGAAWSIHFDVALLKGMGPFFFALAVVWILVMTTSGSFIRQKKQVGRSRHVQRSFRSLPDKRAAQHRPARVRAAAQPKHGSRSRR